MGYSAFTPLHSKKAVHEMMAFLAPNFRPWHKIQPGGDGSDESLVMGFEPVSPENDWTGFLATGSGLDYNGGPRKIGFNFSSSSGALGYYGFSLLRWMALQAGDLHRVSKKDFGNLGKSVPVMGYDHDPLWPVLTHSQWDGIAPDQCWWCLVDDQGFKRMRRPWNTPESRNGTVPVVTKILLTSVTDAQRQQIDDWMANNLGMAPGSFAPEEDGTYILAGDTTALYSILKFLSRENITFSTRKGPPVLTGRRAQMAEKGEPLIQEVERVTKQELERLTDLWRNR